MGEPLGCDADLMSSLPAPQWALGQGFPVRGVLRLVEMAGTLHLSLAYYVWGHPKISEVLVPKLRVTCELSPPVKSSPYSPQPGEESQLPHVMGTVDNPLVRYTGCLVFCNFQAELSPALARRYCPPSALSTLGSRSLGKQEPATLWHPTSGGCAGRDPFF